MIGEAASMERSRQRRTPGCALTLMLLLADSSRDCSAALRSSSLHDCSCKMTTTCGEQNEKRFDRGYALGYEERVAEAKLGLTGDQARR